MKNKGQSIPGKKETTSHTWILDLIIQDFGAKDQDQDPGVSKPRPRMRLYKLSLKPSQDQDISPQNSKPAMYAMQWLVHTADPDKTKLSSPLVHVGSVITIGYATELSSLVCSCVHTADNDKTKQFYHVMSAV